MNLSRFPAAFAALAVLASLLGARETAAAPAPEADHIVVSRAAGEQTAEGQWIVTLPKDQAGHLQDQVWLVSNGHSEGLAGGFISPIECRKPLCLTASVNGDMDSAVKDILQAQGLPVKPDVSVYRVSYGVNRPSITSHATLRFRHGQEAFLYNTMYQPETARYKFGDRITLFDGVLLDSGIGAMTVFDPKDPLHQPRPGLPVDLVQHVMIQVQFLPAAAYGKISRAAAR